MKQVNYLIIGGGIAGTNAADTIREKDTSSSVLIITSEKNRLYSRVLLPTVLEKDLALTTAFLKKESYYEQNQIELWLDKKVTSIDFNQKQVLLADGEEVGYEKLLIATGGEPNRLGIPGENLAGVFTFKTMEDSEKIAKKLKTSTNGVVIGGRFIAFDFINIFMAHSIDTTLVINGEGLFAPFIDKFGSQLLVNILKDQGVRIEFKQQAKSFSGKSGVEKVHLDSGSALVADIVGVGIGITPDLSFLRVPGLIVNYRIQTNQYLETKIENVWAAGDVTRYLDVGSGRYHSLGNWANAADQGRVAAQNMLGEKTVFEATSSYSINFFNTSLALIGDPSVLFASEVITRGSVEEQAYGNLFIKEDHLIGATLIGLPKDRGPLGNLIKKKVKIPDKNKLKDINFDLREFLDH